MSPHGLILRRPRHCAAVSKDGQGERGFIVAILRDALAALGLLRMRPEEVGKLWK
jgi:hypothetical protein